jgi:RNA polymerase sigma-54 factor
MTIKNQLVQKLQQKLNHSLQQAVYVLQLPVADLAAFIELQIEQNPLMQPTHPSPQERAEEKFNLLDELDETFVEAIFPDHPQEAPSAETLIPATTTLYHHLMAQAKAQFSRADLEKAEQIIGHLDARGFLTDFNADPDILAKIQTFDPPGIAARDLRECLLIQLRGKEKSLAYLAIRDHFKDLLEAKWTYLTQKLGYSAAQIQSILRQEIAPLHFHPASPFNHQPPCLIIPDIIIDSFGTIEINEELLPPFTLTPCPELKYFYTAGKWVEKMVARRRQILTQIMQTVIEKHPDFLQGSPTLSHPLTLQEIAAKLGLHLSTVARAVKDKYVAAPQGLFPLSHFFPHTAAISQAGEKVSDLRAKLLLKELVAKEDKQKPHSDEALANLMQKAGIPCARRTVTKYRHLLKIPAAMKRRRP